MEIALRVGKIAARKPQRTRITTAAPKKPRLVGFTPYRNALIE
jgi:hypothetical protein